MELNKKIVFTVDGMHCGGCASKIKNKFQEITTTQTTNIDVAQKSVSVEFNSHQNTVAQFKEGITACGFTVESIEILS